MEKTIDLNSSFMSTASAISAIGLESTLTEEFQELKAFQAEVAHQVDRVVDYFDRVKDIVVDELKNGSGQRLLDLETFDEERHTAVDLLRSYYEKTAVAVQFHVDERTKRRVKKIHRFVNNNITFCISKLFTVRDRIKMRYCSISFQVTQHFFFHCNFVEETRSENCGFKQFWAKILGTTSLLLRISNALYFFLSSFKVGS